MRRRNFIKVSCLGCVGTVAGISLLESCVSSYIAGSVTNNMLTIKKSDFIVVKKDKQVERDFVVVKNDAYPFPVVVYKISSTEYSALYMECTHQGCELNAYQTQLVCPCHGSEFDTKGNVLQGPADIPLKNFEVKTDDQNIYIKIV
jgi:cytochrome b6-f complex iron-sulfur subunit